MVMLPTRPSLLVAISGALTLGLAGLGIAPAAAQVTTTTVSFESPDGQVMNWSAEPLDWAEFSAPAYEEGELQLTQTLPEGTFDLVDVAPTHWAYTAVRNLTENYACISGYPDGTFRGDQAMTRNEFAAAIAACMDNLLELRQERLGQQESLHQELDALNQELRELEGDVDGVEDDL
jgi:hypothetical protein